jgi:hypothetical protein
MLLLPAGSPALNLLHFIRHLSAFDLRSKAALYLLILFAVCLLELHHADLSGFGDAPLTRITICPLRTTIYCVELSHEA